jgi:hypothetical protein
MTITQTIEIPADRRITLEVPPQIPIGRASVEYKIIPFDTKKSKRKMTPEEEKKWFEENSEWLNKEAMDVLEYQADIWGDDDE